MAPSHRPDFEALKREESAPRPNGVTAFRDWFMWPSINLEDLTLKRSMLHFLHSRGRHPPSTFARSDYNRTGLAYTSGAVGTPFLNKHTMYLDGETPTKYGRLVSWDDDEDAFEDSKSGRAFAIDPGQGLLSLEIQERIMTFLIESCKIILHDLNESGSLCDPEFPVEAALSKITTDASEYPTVVALAIERQYRPPIVFDYKRMRSIVSAKCAEAEDHIWSLREDPSYFADTITEWSEHRRERLPDTNGDDHPVGPKVTQDHALFWERVIAFAAANSYGSLINWNIIERQLRTLEALHEKYSTVMSPEKTLPHEYLKALLTFRQMLTEAQRRVMTNLENDAAASPPLRCHYVRQPQSSHTTAITIMQLPLPQRAKGKDNLLFILEILWDPIKTFKFGLSDLLDQLEHLIIDDPSQKARLSPKVTDLISDLGIFAQLRDELDNYQPWAAGMDYEFSKVHEEIEKDVFAQFSARQIIDSNMKYVSTGLEALGAPVVTGFRNTHKRFYYPSEKRRTKENHEAMRQAEAELDAFWAKFDAKYKYKVGKTINEIVEGFLFEKRDLKRTPEWVALTEVIAKKSRKEALEKSFSRFDLETDDSSAQKLSKTSKTKPKTKGQASTSQADSAEPEIQSTHEDTQPIFHVDPRSLKVFRTLFFTPNQTDTPGEIPWLDFLHAMDKTGFKIEKLYGSVWHFEPTKLDVERDINFHEPHPHSKIPYKIARRMGRRLGRAYGWHVGMFVVQ
ncbi:hypothetical protein BKA65DRAFT_609300 [Rhexocercosporidium sp. MPI-PUGE-AT-0058]|nr:hypothetical protein BKA65DRAFT_609300 [Rhexocercosporidium sp. MPI-PUGE-AT-0058]